MGLFDSDYERGLKHGIEFQKSKPGLVWEVLHGLGSMAASFVAIGTNPKAYEAGFESGREMVRKMGMGAETASSDNAPGQGWSDAGGDATNSSSFSSAPPRMGEEHRRKAFLDQLSGAAISTVWVIGSILGAGGATWVMSQVNTFSLVWFLALAVFLLCLPGLVVAWFVLLIVVVVILIVVYLVSNLW